MIAQNDWPAPEPKNDHFRTCFFIEALPNRILPSLSDSVRCFVVTRRCCFGVACHDLETIKKPDNTNQQSRKVYPQRSQAKLGTQRQVVSAIRGWLVASRSAVFGEGGARRGSRRV